MKRITAFLLAAVMALSLLTVAGAVTGTKGTVVLKIEPAAEAIDSSGAATLDFYVYLQPQGDANDPSKIVTEVGAAQFQITCPAGTVFTGLEMNPEYIYVKDTGTVSPADGSPDGIFNRGTITSVSSGYVGGSLDADADGNKTVFKAVLAGTDSRAATYRMLNNTNCSKYLYKLTVAKADGGHFAADASCKLSADKSDATIGYDDSLNTSDIKVRHDVKVESYGYGSAADVTVQVRGKTLESACTVNGQTVTVTHTAACVVLAKTDDGYEKLIATKNGDAYDFTAPDGVSEVVVGLKGDVSGDGKITNADAATVKAAFLEKVTLNAEQLIFADASGDGRITNADITLLKAIYLERATATWN